MTIGNVINLIIQWAVCVFIGFILGVVVCDHARSLPTQAPDVPVSVQTAPERLITFNDLLDAIEQVESGGDANAVGDWTTISLTEEEWLSGDYFGSFFEGQLKEPQAIGSFQIHKIYVDDVNRITGLNYSYEDRWHREKSRTMTMLYITHYGNLTTDDDGGTHRERQARIHNGGPNGWKKESTLPYWAKVKAVLYD
jgi:hypothetical protein